MILLLKEKYQAMDNLIADANSELTSAIEELQKIETELTAQVIVNALALEIIRSFSRTLFDEENQKSILTRRISLQTSACYSRHKNDIRSQIAVWIVQEKISEKIIEDYINSHIKPNRVRVEFEFEKNGWGKTPYVFATLI